MSSNRFLLRSNQIETGEFLCRHFITNVFDDVIKVTGRNARTTCWHCACQRLTVYRQAQWWYMRITHVPCSHSSLSYFSFWLFITFAFPLLFVIPDPLLCFSLYWTWVIGTLRNAIVKSDWIMYGSCNNSKAVDVVWVRFAAWILRHNIESLGKQNDNSVPYRFHKVLRHIMGLENIHYF